MVLELMAARDISDRCDLVGDNSEGSHALEHGDRKVDPAFCGVR